MEVVLPCSHTIPFAAQVIWERPMTIENFVRDMKERARGELLEVSDGGTLETREFNFKAGWAELFSCRARD